MPLSVGKDAKGGISSVRISSADDPGETELPAARPLLSAGTWTPEVFASLFKDAPVSIPVAGRAGHSLSVKSTRHVDERCYAVYCRTANLSPELYSRTSGIIYVAGVNSSAIPLPRHATEATPVPASLQELEDVASQFISSDGDLKGVRAGLCFRLITNRGVPILTRVDDRQLGEGVKTRPGAAGGVFFAVGPGPWGISLSLGTGKVMAGMMQGMVMSADVSSLGL